MIGREAQAQFERAGVYPDIMVGCTGGGSSFGGFIFPFVPDKLSGERGTRFVAVEPTAAPSLTGGQYRYDFGDAAATTPLIKMYTLGHSFVPAPAPAHAVRVAIDEALQGGGRIEGDRHQPVRLRPLRHAGVPFVPRRPARQLRVSPGTHHRSVGGAARGRLTGDS